MDRKNRYSDFKMRIISDYTKDKRTPKLQKGSYEWWYFDGVSADEEVAFTVIFFEGNPFSGRYIKAPGSSGAGCFPAISISVYMKGKPVYYGFIEHDPVNCHFSARRTFCKAGENEFYGRIRNRELHYRLILDQTLPGNDSIRGVIDLVSPAANLQLQNNNRRGAGSAAQEKMEHPCRQISTAGDPDQSARASEGKHAGPGEKSGAGCHTWNIVQNRADVRGEIHIDGFDPHSIQFEGVGYHDHNVGTETMARHFLDWYWGRFHFDHYTLVYFIMRQKEGILKEAWLTDKSGRTVRLIGEIRLEDYGFNLFGLKSAKKIVVEGEHLTCFIQQESPCDNGPFYQRFLSKGILKTSTGIEKTTGLTEYLFPGTIGNRFLRPLVNMRIVYPDKTHWVQKSPRLYRWIW
ncbi:MAG: hypothetical protein WEC12_02040 [Balneolaceae bacterium]